MAGDYTQQRNAAATEAVAIGQQLAGFRQMEAQLMRGIAASQDPILINQLMEDLEETRKQIRTLKTEAKKPPVTETAAPQAPTPVPTAGSQEPGPVPQAPPPIPEGGTR